MANARRYEITGAGLSQIDANPSGIYPTEYKVLISPKAVEEKTAGGIILPDDTKQVKEAIQTEGMLIAVSPVAFNYEPAENWAGTKPKPGDRVLYAKYAGVTVKGNDGLEYKLVNDRDVCAVLS